MVVGPGIYYVGVVDTLTTWTVKKRLERWIKTALWPNHADGISCMPPAEYAARFKRKIREIVEHDFVRQLPS